MKPEKATEYLHRSYCKNTELFQPHFTFFLVASVLKIEKDNFEEETLPIFPSCSQVKLPEVCE